MEKFFRFFAARNLLAYIITLMALLLGATTLLNIKRDSFPEVDFGEILITTRYPGASPEDVELKVTNNIEKQLKDVAGLQRYVSWSMENMSIVDAILDPDEKDQEKVAREVREAIAGVTGLPEEVTESPLVTELDTSVFPVIEVGITGNLPYGELREIARQFEKKLENVAGVSKIERIGYRAREIKVEVSPKEIKKYQISLQEIIRAVAARNVRATGGSFESYTSERNIVTLAQFHDPLEVGDVIVKSQFSGPLIKIKDLAIVKDDFAEEKVMSRVEGQSAISLIPHKTSSADIIRVVDAISLLVQEESTRLPAGVNMLLSDDRSKYVKNRIAIVNSNGLIGLAFVLVVLTLSLNLRIAFWVALGIPVAILGVIFLLPMFDTFLDSITLTAMVLVLGIIVDDAIIIAESIYQKFEQGLSALDAAVQGVSEVFHPVLTTILTTFAAFAPLFFMPGMLGKFVYVIPLVITLALCVSLVESTLALPAHLAAGLRQRPVRNGERDQNTHIHRVRERYRKLLRRLLHWRYYIIALFSLVLAGAIYAAFVHMDFILFPSSTADRFIIQVKTPVGSSLQATSDRVREVEALVAALDKTELDSYMTRIGSYGDIGSSEREDNAAVLVNLTPFAARTRSADAIIEQLRLQTGKLAGLEKVTYIVDAGGPPVGRPITMRVIGSDDALRKKLADDLSDFLRAFHGAKDIDRDDKPGKQQLLIKLDYEKLSRVGISVADVARNVRIAYDGEVVTNVRYGEEDVDFRVIFSTAVRKHPDNLRDLQLPNSNGLLTPLGLVAKFENAPGPATYVHYKGVRTIVITGDIDTAITTPLKISEAVTKHFDVNRDYPGIRLEMGGEAEESAKSLTQLFVILAIAAIGIYFLLVLLFDSLWQPLLVMTAIPFGIVGVIVGFFIHGEPLGFLAMTGIIGLAGVVVNDSLVLVSHVNALRQRHAAATITDLIATGAADRLRAIVITTMSTVAGLLPLAYGIGGSDPYMSPMALALGWGLLFATPLTLLLVPCLYHVGMDFSRLRARSAHV